jgi:hypothetical protein
MQRFLIRSFVVSAGVLLSVTALAKFISLFGGPKILQVPDPVFGLPFGYLFLIIGGIEFAVAGVCLFGRKVYLQTGLIAWIATGFVVYRMGLILIDYQKPCPCMGNLTDALHIPPHIADTILKCIVAYLFVGSYAALGWLWKQHRTSGLASIVVGGASVSR